MQSMGRESEKGQVTYIAQQDRTFAVTGRGRARAALVLCAAVTIATVAAAQAAPPSDVNLQSDPRQLYGHCGGDGSSYQAKEQLLYQVGGFLGDTPAISVISCGPASGTGGTARVPCPSGVPYAYCIATDNDGLGNSVLLGVVVHNENWQTNQSYKGCPPGATPRWKAGIVEETGQDLRLINSIATLSCTAATGGPETAKIIPCPEGPHPFAYCVGTLNDGAGNAVVLGVVAANGAGDIYGLYGKCHSGATSAFRTKKSVLRAMGISFYNIASLILLKCGDASTGIPTAFSTVPCTTVTKKPARFDQCVWGKDVMGNYLVLGISNAKPVP